MFKDKPGFGQNLDILFFLIGPRFFFGPSYSGSFNYVGELIVLTDASLLKFNWSKARRHVSTIKNKTKTEETKIVKHI